jgi:hypothetical protein
MSARTHEHHVFGKNLDRAGKTKTRKRHRASAVQDSTATHFTTACFDGLLMLNFL